MTTTDPTYLLDVNVLIALTNTSHVHHDAAHQWLGLIPDAAWWATCPMTEASFVRLMLNPLVAGRALRPASVLHVLAGVRSQSRHRFVADASSLADPLVSLMGLAGPKLVTDLHLVNLAAKVGAVLATFDSRLALMLVPADRRHLEVIRPTSAR